MVVVTRSQAKRQLEEEILRREGEILSGAKTNPVGDPELPNPQDDGKDGPHPSVETTPTLTQEQRRTLQQQLGNRATNFHSNVGKRIQYSVPMSTPDCSYISLNDSPWGY